MTYQIIITEETAANIIIDNNTTNVSITTNDYPITIEYNAVITQAGANTTYGDSNVRTFLASGTNTGNIISTANVSGAFILGNGSQLTGIAASYGNANVAANLAAFGSNPISTSGNITAGYFLGNGSQLTGLPVQPGTYGNANVAANLAAFGSNPISTTGNITATNFVGNGSLLTSITGANVTGTVANATYALNANAATYATTAVQANVANVANSVAGANVSGTVANATYALNSNAATFATQATFATTANAVAGANVSGTVANATYALNANASTFATQATFAGTANAVAGANVSGTVANATYALNSNAATFAGTVTTAAQPNITSVGILTAVNTSGNVSATGNVTGNYFVGNGSQLTGLPATYGNANVAANLAAFANNPISTSGNITAGYFIGNGSALTGVIATDAIHATTLRFPVKNTSGGTLAQNTPVYITGSVGATETLEVSASRADTAGTMPCAGLLETALGVNAFGYAVAIGALSSTDTSTFTIGQTLYVGATGGITQSRPTNANVVQSVGTAGRINASTGQIEVNIWNQEGLPNLGSGNVWLGNATAFPTQTTLATYTGNIGAGYLSVSGNVDAGNLRTAGQVTATGNVSGGNINTGNLYIAPNVGQIGNVVINTTQPYVVQSNNANIVPQQSRIVIGNGWDGNYSRLYDPSNRIGLAKLAVWEKTDRTDTAGAGSTALVTNFHQQRFMNGNVANGTTRNFSVVNAFNVGGGPAANVSTATSPVAFAAMNGLMHVGNIGTIGGAASQANVGNTSMAAATAGAFINQIWPGSDVTTIYGVVAGTNPGGSESKATNVINYTNWNVNGGSGTANLTPTTFVSYYHANASSSLGAVATFDAYRAAPNYYAFRNDDNVAQVQLGSLRSYNEYQATPAATTGTVNIDKSLGQVQLFTPTGNVTIGSFQNFVFNASNSVSNIAQTDTVTMIITQGATPYTVTMPTGNAQIKYAGGVSTVGSTANAVTMISITGTKVGNAATAGTGLYLVTVSSEFS
jgi:hypothetical protein